MSPILPGTVCLVVGDHGAAGHCCTVVEGERIRVGWVTKTEYGTYVGYRIDVPTLPNPTRNGATNRWGALRRHLVPLTPPTLPERSERRRQAPTKVRA